MVLARCALADRRHIKRLCQWDIYMDGKEVENYDVVNLCAIIRRKWTNDSFHKADSMMMLAATMLNMSVEDMDSIRPHLEILAEKRDVARNAIKDFKNTLERCRERIRNAKNTQRWITANKNKEVSLDLVSETAGFDTDDVIRRMLKSLDKKTYYYLAEIKGSSCPLCGAKQ